MSALANRRARRNVNVAVAAGVLAIAGVVAFATIAAAHGDHTEGDEQPTAVYQLSEAEIAALDATIAPFADPADAVAAGRADLDLCFDMMGDHYADRATFADGELDPQDPEALVYADVDGTVQLVAVEWVSTSPGQVLGIPLHLNHDLDVWVLHAWVGLGNPSGMLADHNPDVGACPTA